VITGTNPLFTTLTGIDPTGVEATNEKLIFENGLAVFTIPASPPARLLETPAAVVPVVAPVFVREIPQVIANAVVDAPDETTAASNARGTDVHFEIWRKLPDESEELVSKDIKPDEFTDVDSLKELINDAEKPIQDGTGYEVRLILEVGGKKISRSVLEFDVNGGEPQVTESNFETGDAPELKIRTDFMLEPKSNEQISPPAEESANPADGDQASIDASSGRAIEAGKISPQTGKGNDAGASEQDAIPNMDVDVSDANSVTETSVVSSAAIGVVTSLQVAKLRRRRRDAEIGMSKSARLLRKLSSEQ